MKMLLAFKNVEEEESASCPSPEEVRAELTDYHSALIARLGPQPEEKGKCPCWNGSLVLTLSSSIFTSAPSYFNDHSSST